MNRVRPGRASRLSTFPRSLLLLALSLLAIAAATDPAQASDQKRWQETTARDTIEAYREYLAQGPNEHWSEARERLSELVYQQALQQDTKEGYEKFTSEFYGSPHVPEAQRRMRERAAIELNQRIDENNYADFVARPNLHTAALYLRATTLATHSAEVERWLDARRALVPVPGTKLRVMLFGEETLPAAKLPTGRATLGEGGFLTEVAPIAPRRGSRIVLLHFGFTNTGPDVDLDHRALALTDSKGVSYPCLGWMIEPPNIQPNSLELHEPASKGPAVFVLPVGMLDALMLSVAGRSVATLGSLRPPPAAATGSASSQGPSGH